MKNVLSYITNNLIRPRIDILTTNQQNQLERRQLVDLKYRTKLNKINSNNNKLTVLNKIKHLRKRSAANQLNKYMNVYIVYIISMVILLFIIYKWNRI